MNVELRAEINRLDKELNEKFQKANDTHQAVMRKDWEDFNYVTNEIWELSKQKYLLKSKLDPGLQNYEGLIFTVGKTSKPIILNILASEPKYVFFIYYLEQRKYRFFVQKRQRNWTGTAWTRNSWNPSAKPL